MSYLRMVFEDKGCCTKKRPFGQLCIIVADYGNDPMPGSLEKWVKKLTKPDARELYRICRKKGKGVMPELVLKHIDKQIEVVEKDYRKDQKRKKSPMRSLREKHNHDTWIEGKNIKFFLETREKIKAGSSQKDAAGPGNADRKYRKLEKKYDEIVCQNIDKWVMEYYADNMQ